MHLQPSCCGAALRLLLPDCCLVYLGMGPAAALITGLKGCSSSAAASLYAFGSASDLVVLFQHRPWLLLREAEGAPWQLISWIS